MNSQERKRFRQTKRWLEFRKRLIEEQKTDPITGNRLSKTANCHHKLLDYDRYTDLTEENFVILNKNSHDCVHFLFLKSDPRAWRKRILALIRILKHMEILNTK
jgi:hypothetical protein